MQIKSSDGAMTVDYYEVKNFLGEVNRNVRLRVLTFVTETVNKRLIHVNDMADELMDRLLKSTGIVPVLYLAYIVLAFWC